MQTLLGNYVQLGSREELRAIIKTFTCSPCAPNLGLVILTKRLEASAADLARLARAIAARGHHTQVYLGAHHEHARVFYDEGVRLVENTHSSDGIEEMLESVAA